MVIKRITDYRSIIKTLSEIQKTFLFGGFFLFCFGFVWFLGLGFFFVVVGCFIFFKPKRTACKVNLRPPQELQLAYSGIYTISNTFSDFW